jgi:predicted RNase H-like HicB family nuclease
MLYKVNVVIEKDDHGYYAYSPELEGCQSQGDSYEEALANIREAVELYLETLSEEERTQYLSKEIMTTSLEVNLA